MTVIERMADWATNAPAIHSEKAQDIAKQVIEDLIGCSVAGAGDEAAACVRNTIANWGTGKATVVGGARRSQAPWAALANGMAAHALDFDDTFSQGGSIHASAVLVPSLLALGEELNASGAAIIDAYIIGLELFSSLARGLMPSHYDHGWHATSTIGCIGAAGACGRLLRLDAKRMAHALSLAVSMAAGCKVQFGSMAKPLHAGLAAQHAVQAAKLAASGVEGRLNALEGPLGFLHLYGGPAPAGWDGKLDALGQSPAIETRGLMVKRFPCVASTHRVLDCVLELQHGEGFAASDVAKVDTLVGYGDYRNLMYPNPQTELEARFSMQYCVAVALLYGTVRLSDFSPTAVRREEVRTLLPLTTVKEYDANEEQKTTDLIRPHVVEIRLKNGRKFERSRDLPKGSIKYPLDEADRAAKFVDCCQGFLHDDDISALRRDIGRLETIKRVRSIAGRLRFKAGADRGERFDRRVTV